MGWPLRHIVNKTIRLIRRIILPLRLRVYRLIELIRIRNRIRVRVRGGARLRL
jgi:hypothetical protein